MRTSTIYTIGTALTRAQGTGVTVDVLINGQWLCGQVGALDGHGLVLHRDDGVLSVLRMQSIDAVQVRQAAAFEERPEVEAHPQGDMTHPAPPPGGAHCSDSYAMGGAETAAEPPARSTVVPLPRRVDLAAPAGCRMSEGPDRPTIGPIVSPYAQPDAGLHTKLRSRRTPTDTSSSLT